MNIANKPAAFTAMFMLAVAIFVLFALPAATDDSEKAFRLIVAGAAVFAAIIKLRRAFSSGGDRPDRR